MSTASGRMFLYNTASEADLAEAAQKIERSRENSTSTAQTNAAEVGNPKVKPYLTN